MVAHSADEEGERERGRRIGDIDDCGVIRGSKDIVVVVGPEINVCDLLRPLRANNTTREDTATSKKKHVLECEDWIKRERDW